MKENSEMKGSCNSFRSVKLVLHIILLQYPGPARDMQWA